MASGSGSFCYVADQLIALANSVVTASSANASDGAHPVTLTPPPPCSSSFLNTLRQWFLPVMGVNGLICDDASDSTPLAKAQSTEEGGAKSSVQPMDVDPPISSLRFPHLSFKPPEMIAFDHENGTSDYTRHYSWSFCSTHAAPNVLALFLHHSLAMFPPDTEPQQHQYLPVPGAAPNVNRNLDCDRVFSIDGFHRFNDPASILAADSDDVDTTSLPASHSKVGIIGSLVMPSHDKVPTLSLVPFQAFPFTVTNASDCDPARVQSTFIHLQRFSHPTEPSPLYAGSVRKEHALDLLTTLHDVSVFPRYVTLVCLFSFFGSGASFLWIWLLFRFLLTFVSGCHASAVPVTFLTTPNIVFLQDDRDCFSKQASAAHPNDEASQTLYLLAWAFWLLETRYGNLEKLSHWRRLLSRLLSKFKWTGGTVPNSGHFIFREVVSATINLFQSLTPIRFSFLDGNARIVSVAHYLRQLLPTPDRILPLSSLSSSSFDLRWSPSYSGQDGITTVVMYLPNDGPLPPSKIPEVDNGMIQDLNDIGSSIKRQYIVSAQGTFYDEIRKLIVTCNIDGRFLTEEVNLGSVTENLNFMFRQVLNSLMDMMPGKPCEKLVKFGHKPFPSTGTTFLSSSLGSITIRSTALNLFSRCLGAMLFLPSSWKLLQECLNLDWNVCHSQRLDAIVASQEQPPPPMVSLLPVCLLMLFTPSTCQLPCHRPCCIFSCVAEIVPQASVS